MKFHVSNWKSEILLFDGFLLSKSYKVSAKRVHSSYLSWHWIVIQSLKIWHENLVNFHSNIQKSENFFLMDSFCLKYKRFELQKYKGVSDEISWWKRKLLVANQLPDSHFLFVINSKDIAISKLKSQLKLFPSL